MYSHIELSEMRKQFFRHTLDVLQVERDSTGNPPIFQRVLRGESFSPDSLEIIMQNEFGNTLLHLCVGNLKCTQFLLKRGAYVNTENHLGQTPLTMALGMNRQPNKDEVFEVIRSLVNYGAVATAYNYFQARLWGPLYEHRLLALGERVKLDGSITVDQVREQLDNERIFKEQLEQLDELN